MSEIKKNIKGGYKKTKLGWIPEDWKVLSLENLVKKDRPVRYGIVQTGENISDGISCLRVVDLTSRNFDKNNMIKTTPEISQSYSKTLLEKDDIVFALRGEIGDVILVDERLEGVNLTRGVALISHNSEVLPEYLLWQLRSPLVRHKMLLEVNGTSLKEIPISALRKIKIPLTREKEQQKIASILSTWDTAIQKTQQLIEKKQQLKKGLMQQLLTGKVRLKEFQNNGKWKVSRLEEYFTERKEIGFDNLPLLSIGQLGVYPQDQSNKKDTSNTNKQKYKRICHGDIGYNTMRMWQGRSALSHLEGIVSPAYTIVTPKGNASPLFFAYLFKMPSVVHRFYRNSQGLTSDTLNCKFKDFKIVRVLVPPTLKEQEAIANVFEKVDEEIEILQRDVGFLEEQKKGLMQQLLTGKIRVKT